MKTIAIDMDDVLANTAKKLRTIYEEEYQKKWTKEELAGKNFRDLVEKGDVAEHIALLNKPGFFRDLDVMENAVEVMRELNKKYEIFIVSAAMEFPNSLRDKYEWVQEHLPFITWKQICLCGLKSFVQTDVMIDDRTRNFTHFKGRPLLFTAHHNLHEENYERVKDWKEVAEKLL